MCKTILLTLAVVNTYIGIHGNIDLTNLFVGGMMSGMLLCMMIEDFVDESIERIKND